MSIHIKNEKRDCLHKAMQGCLQTKGQSVLQHGQSVFSYYNDIIEYLHDEESALIHEWRLPTWLTVYKEQILNSLYGCEITSAYQVYHDCGKPFCREVDDEGRVHFPDHAKVSKQVYLDHAVDSEDNRTVANLIGWDMVLHTENAGMIDKYCEHQWTIQDAMTLLITSLCEVHSNAALFGGIDSISFKSKWKKLDRRGRQLCRRYFGEVAK